MKLNSVSFSDFYSLLQRDTLVARDYVENYFTPYIEQAKSYAVGPFFWLIPEQNTMTVLAASPNMHQLTPYTQAEWVGKTAGFWLENMHPEDRDFVMAASIMLLQLQENTPPERAEKVRMNVYLRMINSERKYRWVLLQFPVRLYSEDQKVLSALIMTTDLSHLNISTFSRMMTIIDYNDDGTQYFATSVETNTIKHLPHLPSISNREQQVLQLIIKGLNTPQIADTLFISYYTVENHKRHLREKTNTKTSGELVAYAFTNNLL